MKKALSLLMVFVLLASSSAYFFAFAAEPGYVDIPIIHIYGNGNDIYSEDESKVVFPVTYNTKQLPSAIARVLFPYFTNAVLFGKWDEYYDAFYNEVDAIYNESHLDENGNATNGTDIKQSYYTQNKTKMGIDYLKRSGKYGLHSYSFWYDWRLDPMENADKLDEYIRGIMKTTGRSQISLAARCLGSVVVFAYLEKYGTDHIKAVAFDSMVGNGNETISDLFTGKIKLDGKALERYQAQVNNGWGNEPGESEGYFLAEFVDATLGLANEAGLIETGSKLFDKIYKKLYDGLVPRIVMASFGTWPGYWAVVKAEDYQTARELVFGVEEYRTKYAGLIEKLDNYDEKVRQRIPEILTAAKENDTNIGIISKYGYQAKPWVENGVKLGDGLASLDRASLGATCSIIGETLSDEYIAQRVAEGNEKYISADKQVDASTCLFPDYTWIVKNIHHNTFELDDVLYSILTYDGQFDVYTKSDYPQFMVYDYKTNSFAPLTEENCDVSPWGDTNMGDSNIKTGFSAIVKFFKALNDYIIVKLKIWFNDTFKAK